MGARPTTSVSKDFRGPTHKVAKSLFMGFRTIVIIQVEFYQAVSYFEEKAGACGIYVLSNSVRVIVHPKILIHFTHVKWILLFTIPVPHW